MDNEDDDDGNFTKWMSSYWGHGSGGEERPREMKRSFRRHSQAKVDRRASLPCVSQLEVMQLNHNTTMPPTPVHMKRREEKAVRPHPSLRRARSDDNSPKPPPTATENRITTIPELSEAMERRLHIHNQKLAARLAAETRAEPHTEPHAEPHAEPHTDARAKHSLTGDLDNFCLICEGVRGGRGMQELHCSHRFHKECIEEWLWRKRSCPTCRFQVAMPEPLYWSSARVQFP